MSGFCIDYKEFDIDKVTWSKGPQQAKVPDGMGKASEIFINYKYENNDKEIKEYRLVVEGPVLRTSTGIKNSEFENGKPAIAVVFDMEDPDQKLFAGSFGNKHEYVKSKGSVTRVHEKYIKPSGVLGSLYDWSVEAYAKFKSMEEGGDINDLSPLEYRDASNEIKTSLFFYQRVHKEGELKDKIIENSNPMKFFKLLNYAPGTPEENIAKFYLPDGTKVDNASLHGKSFSFKPFISFRRIFIGKSVSVTMELTEAVITDFYESSSSISMKSSRLIQRLNETDPEKAAIVAEKYHLLMSENSIKDDIISKPGITIEAAAANVDLNIDESCVNEVEYSDPVSKRPKLPSSLKD